MLDIQEEINALQLDSSGICSVLIVLAIIIATVIILLVQPPPPPLLDFCLMNSMF